MSQGRIDDIASQLAGVRRGRLPLIAADGDHGPENEAEAYAIQFQVMDILGQTPGAWKVGGPLDTAPRFAPIYAADITYAPASIGAWEPVGIECEIAFRLGRDIPSQDGHCARQDILASIDAVFPMIETVGSRLQNFVDAPPLWKLADNQVNLGIILGNACRAVKAEQWQEADISLKADGKTVKHVSGSNPGGDSIDLVVWLANNLARYGGSLMAGQFVTAGSFTGVDFFGAGTEIEADFGPLGQITINLTSS